MCKMTLRESRLSSLSIERYVKLTWNPTKLCDQKYRLFGFKYFKKEKEEAFLHMISSKPSFTSQNRHYLVQ